MYRLTEKLKDIFDYYENNIGDLQWVKDILCQLIA
jgi:hypothetical protein